MDRVERVGTLLVGGGVASVRCARTLRKLGYNGRILIVSSEPTLPYNRPPLSKELLRDELPDDLVMAESASWYERRAVELRLGTEVLELDPDGGSALLADGTRVGFERCLLATGAEPRALRVPGGEHALLLRTLPDARRLRAMAVAAGGDAPVTIVGGGFIGVEVASGLAALGLRPTVIEMTDRLWGGSLGGDLDTWARERLVDAGVGIRTGVAVTRLEEDGAWIGEERLDHAFCVAGIGVVPRTSVAEAAGLMVDDGIVVDGEQRSTHRSVWAAGDVARLGEQRVEHWHAAREAGERAARAMLGEPSVPVPGAVGLQRGGGATDRRGRAWLRRGTRRASSAIPRPIGSRLPTSSKDASRRWRSSTRPSASRRRVTSSSGGRAPPSSIAWMASWRRRPADQARPDASQKENEQRCARRQDDADDPVVGPA